MRRAAGACAILVAAAAGCLGPSARPAADFRRPTGGLPPALPDGLYVESVLLERPLGDPALDHELWQGESSAIPPATRALLAENGLRAAVLTGNPLPAFQRLLDSADAHDGRGQTFANRAGEVVPTAGPTDPCEYHVLTALAGEKTRVSLRQARGGVQVRPERTPDGRVRVRCEPRVQHGEREERYRPTADVTGFTMQGEVPLEAYPALGFEVTLGPGDYLLIGSPSAATETLGAALFVADAGGRPRQRVLAVRATWRGEKPAELPVGPGRRRSSPAAEAARW